MAATITVANAGRKRQHAIMHNMFAEGISTPFNSNYLLFVILALLAQTKAPLSILKKILLAARCGGIVTEKLDEERFLIEFNSREGNAFIWSRLDCCGILQVQ